MAMNIYSRYKGMNKGEEDSRRHNLSLVIELTDACACKDKAWYRHPLKSWSTRPVGVVEGEIPAVCDLKQ